MTTYSDRPIRRDVWTRVEMGIAIFGVAFMTTGLNRVIQGYTPLEAATSESPLIQLTGALLYLFCGVVIALRYQTYAVLLERNWFVFVPVFIAFASMQWSVEPDVTFRRSIALFGTVLFGLYVGGRFRFSEIGLILFVALSILVLWSCAAAILDPRFGVHQANEGVQAHHAGLWRGVFAHKNVLGPVASICLFVTLALWRSIPFRDLAKAAVCAAALLAILKAGSAQAMAQAVLISCAILAHRTIAALGFHLKLVIFSVALAVAPIIAIYGHDIYMAVLTLLGRTPSLSGRVEIWQAALLSGSQSPWIGYGYSVGWRGGADVIAVRLTWVDPGHAHNGFLTMWLDTGFVGLAGLLPLWFVFVRRSLIVADHARSLHVLTMYFFLFYMTTNMVDSFLFKRQDIYVVLMVMLVVVTDRVISRSRHGAPTETRTASRSAGFAPS